MNVLSDDLKERIRAYIPRYPNKQAVTIPALHMIQDELRNVPYQAIRELSEILELNPAEIYDAMSFYGFFKEEPKKLGKTRLWVCRSLPCMLRGSDELLKHLSEQLGVKPGQTQPLRGRPRAHDVHVFGRGQDAVAAEQPAQLDEQRPERAQVDDAEQPAEYPRGQCKCGHASSASILEGPQLECGRGLPFQSRRRRTAARLAVRRL